MHSEIQPRRVVASASTCKDLPRTVVVSCDSGLAELSDGLIDHCGQLEFLSLRQNLPLALMICHFGEEPDSHGILTDSRRS